MFLWKCVGNVSVLGSEKENYKLVSLHLLLVGIFIYLLIIINLNDIFYLIPNSQNFISGKNVVYIIGLAKLVTMAFSLNGELIMMSKYFKFNVITILMKYMCLFWFSSISNIHVQVF